MTKPQTQKMTLTLGRNPDATEPNTRADRQEWPDDVTRHSGDGGEGISDFYRSLESRDEGANVPKGQATRCAEDDLTLGWIATTLVNDEASCDQDLQEHFEANGVSAENARFYITQRNDALRDPLHFKLHPAGSLSEWADDLERNRREDEKERIEKEWYENERSRAATADNYWNEALGEDFL